MELERDLGTIANINSDLGEMNRTSCDERFFSTCRYPADIENMQY